MITENQVRSEVALLTPKVVTQPALEYIEIFLWDSHETLRFHPLRWGPLWAIMGSSEGKKPRTEIRAMSYNPITTVSLPEIKWSTISTGLLCFAVDERLKGNSKEADRFMEAWMALKEALKTELS